MRNIFLIARREYLEQIRSRAFRMSTIGLPALFALVLAIGAWSSRGAGSHKHFVVVSSNLALAEAARDRLLANKEHKPTVTVVAPITDDLRAELIEAVKDSAVSGIVSIENANGKPVASYTSKSAGDFMTASKLQSVLSDALVEERLSSAGFTPAESNTLLKGVKVESYQVKKDGAIVKSNAAASFWKGYVMAILLSMTTIIYGMNVARSIIQEKTSRIFEVMLAIAKPADMLAGKLIGVGAVGLTQILIWVVAAGALVASPLASAMLTGQFEVHFSLAEAVLFPLYFLLGYLLFSALFAGLAASCETEQELQMYMPLAAGPTWLSFSMIAMIMSDSNSVWAVAASLFPPTAPIVMFLRMASEQPQLWQIALSIGLLAASIWVTLWISAKLYRVGILMYGKRATLPELVRWLRYS
jgi:ABC-2 type transport system permease protein